MFGKNKRKVECMICGENIENNAKSGQSPKEASISYLKVNGHIGIYFLHKECYQKIQDIREGKRG